MMRSHRSLDRRRSCVGKVTYRMFDDADAAARQLTAQRRERLGTERLMAYQCGFGAHWHIGHTWKQEG